MACRVEQRPPAGAAREQAAVQAVVTAYYDRLARGDQAIPRDTALGAGAVSLIRADVQVQRDLASVWATIRVTPAGEAELPPRVQHLLCRRINGAWVVMHVATAAP